MENNIKKNQELELNIDKIVKNNLERIWKQDTLMIKGNYSVAKREISEILHHYGYKPDMFRKLDDILRVSQNEIAKVVYKAREKKLDFNVKNKDKFLNMQNTEQQQNIDDKKQFMDINKRTNVEKLENINNNLDSLYSLEVHKMINENIQNMIKYKFKRVLNLNDRKSQDVYSNISKILTGKLQENLRKGYDINSVKQNKDLSSQTEEVLRHYTNSIIKTDIEEESKNTNKNVEDLTKRTNNDEIIGSKEFNEKYNQISNDNIVNAQANIDGPNKFIEDLKRETYIKEEIGGNKTKDIKELQRDNKDNIEVEYKNNNDINIPSGWTYLIHGTSTDRWNENILNIGSFTTKNDLSSISENQAKREFDSGANTSKNYSAMSKEKGIPFEIRCLIYEDVVRHTDINNLKHRLSKDEINDISKYHFKNRFFGRHECVPKSTKLVKIGNTNSNNITGETEQNILWFVPEKYKERYHEDVKKYPCKKINDTRIKDINDKKIDKEPEINSSNILLETLKKDNEGLPFKTDKMIEIDDNNLKQFFHNAENEDSKLFLVETYDKKLKSHLYHFYTVDKSGAVENIKMEVNNTEDRKLKLLGDVQMNSLDGRSIMRAPDKDVNEVITFKNGKSFINIYKDEQGKIGIGTSAEDNLKINKSSFKKVFENKKDLDIKLELEKYKYSEEEICNNTNRAYNESTIEKQDKRKEKTDNYKGR